MNRRTFLAALAASPFVARSAFAAAPSDEMFVFVHAAGGWDVTLWSDPRPEKRGIIDPATADVVDIAPIRRWGGGHSFAVTAPRNTSLRLGPGIGNLVDLADRLCVFNGLEMNTVSHPDGTALCVTGRHLQGGRSPQASIEVMLANELGTDALFPAISVQFPSSFANEGRAALDRRAAPLAVDRIGAIGRSLDRSELYAKSADRDRIDALLADEAHDFAARSTYPEPIVGIGAQTQREQAMLKEHMQDLFEEGPLKAAHPELDYKARFSGKAALDAAFAIEAMKRGLARCVAFSSGGFDTHANNYRTQPLVQQDLFDLVAALVKKLDVTPHPHLAGRKLADHTHVVVLSDFCRTPQLNLAGGRDHYPNNSALVISPRWKGGLGVGKTDEDQLLPVATRKFSDGLRATTPADVLATLLATFQIDPRRYLRDGEPMPELLRG